MRLDYKTSKKKVQQRRACFILVASHLNTSSVQISVFGYYVKMWFSTSCCKRLRCLINFISDLRQHEPSNTRLWKGSFFQFFFGRIIYSFVCVKNSIGNSRVSYPCQPYHGRFSRSDIEFEQGKLCRRTRTNME